jgi:carboxyl-terminal processing protease
VSIGERAELKLTMAAYFIPSGRSIDKRLRKDSTLVAMADQDFRTRTLGRLVRGAGGITPDIEVQGRRASPLYRQLDGWRTWNNRFFRFAREYPLRHPDLTPDFVADDEVLKEFRTFVEEQEFDYVSNMERRLLQLKEQAEEDEADDRLEKPIERLGDEIDEIEEDHWQADRDLLAWKLTFDIREKAFGIRAAHAYDVTVNPQILEARRVISDSEEYASYFQRPAIGAPDEGAVASTVDTTAREVGAGALELGDPP